MEDILLRGGTLVDGSGAAPMAGDVLLRGDRILEAGRFHPPAGARVLDCTGRIVSPGFIDTHSHSDLQVLENRREKQLQGVTTEVVGNCGFSAFPTGADPGPLRDFANGIFCGGDRWGWPTAADYLAEVGRCARLVNVVTLVGHGSLRIAHAGTAAGPLPERVLDAMEQSLADSLAAGAAGFSTGLMYAPGQSAPFAELERLCRVVARHNKVYATHLRDYGSRLVEAVEEQIELARRTGCRLQISHLQAVGPRNWHRQVRALELIEKAAYDGNDIGFDCYPYVAGSTVLTQLLPQWTLEGGSEGLMARLRDPAVRGRIAGETISGMAHRWTDLIIAGSGSGANRMLVGQTLQAIADARRCAPVDAAFDLLLEERGAVQILEFNQSEENLRQLVAHPLSLAVSDGFYVRGRPHPRLHGAFPELLGTVCREKQWLPLAAAVHKITGAAASRFRLEQRGLLRPGFFADIAVFDAAAVSSPATYDDPQRDPAGIIAVFRNGRITPPGALPEG